MAQKPWIVPIPGTTKLAHLRENLWSADIVFTSEELKNLTDEISKVKIVGDRYPTPKPNKLTPGNLVAPSLFKYAYI
jgi:diketogulonate reductase-like aldo/keto reductase